MPDKKTNNRSKSYLDYDYPGQSSGLYFIDRYGKEI
jgi:hypothetical protein